MTTTGEYLTLRKVLKDGRVLAVNSWRTGWQELVYASIEHFNTAKLEIEEQGRLPAPRGFTDI